MQRKSKHKEINDSNKSVKYPAVKCGYLDTEKQSKNTEIQEDNEPLKCPLVERGYLDKTKQSNNTGTQEEKNSYNYMIMLCVFVIFILAITGHVQYSPGAFGLSFILLIFLAILFFRINKK